MTTQQYQIRVRVDGRCFTVQLPIRTCSPLESHQYHSLPNFIDLFNIIQDAAKDLRLHEYQISTTVNDYTLTNDDTVHHWLIQSNNSLITRDLVLLHRGIDSKKSTLQQQQQQQQQQQSPGAIEPTVIRWPDHHCDPRDSSRKDFGVGLLLTEEQHDRTPYQVKKKQRLNCSETPSRQLPEPPKRQQSAQAVISHVATSSTVLPPINPPFPKSITIASSSSPPHPTLPALASITANAIRLYPCVKKRTLLLPAPSPTSPFVCDKWMRDGHQCNQTFRRSYDLQRHQTIHLRNRPYSYCNQCGKRFTRIDALRRHERVQGHRPAALGIYQP